jgi:predicted NBD/HSP70 family sugar kinase
MHAAAAVSRQSCSGNTCGLAERTLGHMQVNNANKCGERHCCAHISSKPR